MDAVGKTGESTTVDPSKKWTLRIAKFYSWVGLAIVIWISLHAIPEVIDLDRSYNRFFSGYAHPFRFSEHANEWGQIVIHHHALFVTATFALPIVAAAAMYFLRPVARMVTLFILTYLTLYLSFYVGRAIASST